jgi:DNA-directed RNA polymerase sigma subunit (sigma70/sigma32)
VNLEDTESAAEIAAPLSHGQDRDCSNESEIDALASRAELADEDLEELPERIAAAGIDVSDECGRERVPPNPHHNGELTHYAVDAMTQFLSGVSRCWLRTGPEELELARRIEQGDLGAKERLITYNLRLFVSIAKRYQGISNLTLLDLSSRLRRRTGFGPPAQPWKSWLVFTCLHARVRGVPRVAPHRSRLCQPRA